MFEKAYYRHWDIILPYNFISKYFFPSLKRLNGLICLIWQCQILGDIILYSWLWVHRLFLSTSKNGKYLGI